MDYYQTKLPCDATQIGRFRRVLGEAGGYAHAKQFKRLKATVRRQRTILGVLLREVERKMDSLTDDAKAAVTLWLERARRIHSQRTKDKNKLYALHALEVERIGKGKARKPYEFGVKVSLAITHKQGLVVGARSFPGNPFDGHTLAAQLEQTRTLLQDLDVQPKTAVVDLGYRGADNEIAPVTLIHRGKARSLSTEQRRWLKRRQAIEPIIGHAKHDHRIDKCWLKGSEGDALHAVLCAAGFNIRWLMRALWRQLQARGLRHVFFGLDRTMGERRGGTGGGIWRGDLPSNSALGRCVTRMTAKSASAAAETDFAGPPIEARKL